MKRYRIEMEIFEGKAGELKKEGDEIVLPDFSKEGICAWMHRGDGQRSYQVGQRFRWPEDNGKMCQWLLGSVDGFVKGLRFGATLPWTYKGTPYEKVSDPDGITTEFVRCPDPASCVVVKLIRTVIDD
ncbi:MAG: hypothetical protein AB1817_08040 [Chloroflexota bacterium]